jgi:hypothetical protein
VSTPHEKSLSPPSSSVLYDLPRRISWLCLSIKACGKTNDRAAPSHGEARK